MAKRDEYLKVLLPDSEIPKVWYNIAADIPGGLAPYYSSRTGELLNASEMEVIFPKTIIEQEMSSERYIDIPKEIQEQYKRYRTTPLFRAKALEKAIGTNCRIYYKYEGGNATGSHKLNTALPQAFFNKAEGIKRIATETGAGQWGTAISMACGLYDMECQVYMVKVSYNQKPYRRMIMNTFGANVYASPSTATAIGRKILEKDPDCPGSLGIAISEAVEDAASRSDTSYSLGSVLNHVILHQTVIGLEAQKQIEFLDEYPDLIVACCGGGSNFGGIAFPFVKDKLEGKKVRLLAVEPASCPSLTKGEYAFDYGDTGHFVPIAKMYTLGSEFIPSGIHAGGLRYHGASPLVSNLVNQGIVDAVAVKQKSVFEAAVLFAQHEGIVPAPESSHAIRATIDEAKKYDEMGQEKVILFCLSGNGYFDMSAYDMYLSGSMVDNELTNDEIDNSLTHLPTIKG